MVHANGSVKLADFGLAKEVHLIPIAICAFYFVDTHSIWLMSLFLYIILLCEHLQMNKFDMLKSCKGSIYWMAPEVSCMCIFMRVYRFTFHETSWENCIFFFCISFDATNHVNQWKSFSFFFFYCKKCL